MLVVFIGILGGMGPEATAELYLRIIRIFQRNGAKYDKDFPEILILNLPLPDVVERPDKDSKIRDILVKSVKKLESNGADFVAIPCNSVSYFISDMRKAVSIPILSIPELVKGVNLGVLGTEFTIKKRLYGNIINPTKKQQKQITKIVLNILSGKKTKEDKDILINIIEDLKSKGAEKVILGCTELPLIIKRSDTINTIDVLSKEVFRMYKSRAGSKRGGK
jgi:aspartate racemase